MKINGKVKKYVSQSGKYLREVSVVIIGVAITFMVTDYISNRKEKKEVQQSLKLIHAELEYNLEFVKEICYFYDDYYALYKILNAGAKNPEKINQDSINQYIYVTSTNFSFVYKQAAYNMFINSGVMKNVNQSNLLLNITECYLELEALKKECDIYNDLHGQVWTKLRETLDRNEEFSIFSPKYKSLFNFYSMYRGGIKRANNSKETLEKTLSEMTLVKE